MQPESNGGRSFVNVPVPEEYVLPVMALISRLDAASTNSSIKVEESVEAGTPAAPPSQTRWTEGEVWDSAGELRKIAEGHTETTRLLTEILDQLATTPGNWWNLTELADKLGQDRDKLKYMWTHLSRHLKKHYPGRWWPLDSGWGDVIPIDGQHIAYYRVTDEQAHAWREVRGGSK